MRAEQRDGVRVVQACTWLSDCANATEAACEAQCVFNVFQDFNDDAAAVPGQQTRLGGLIARNQDMIDANGCALLAALIGTCDSGPSTLGISPGDESVLYEAGITLVANIVRPLSPPPLCCGPSLC